MHSQFVNSKRAFEPLLFVWIVVLGLGLEFLDRCDASSAVKTCQRDTVKPGDHSIVIAFKIPTRQPRYYPDG